DDHPSSPGAAAGALRPTPATAEAAGSTGSLLGHIEEPPRELDGAAGPGEAGQQREPDRERGAGDRPPGAGRPFAARVLNGRHGAITPHRSQGAALPSHAARVAAARSPSLFDVRYE